MARTSSKRKQDDQNATEKNAKKQRKAIIDQLATELLESQSNNNTRKEIYRKFTQKMREAQVNMPWLTIDMVKSKAARKKKAWLFRKNKTRRALRKTCSLEDTQKGQPKI